MKYRNDDGVNSAAVRLAEKQLAQIAPDDSPESLLQALEPCLGVAAGLLMVVRPGPTMNVTHHALRMPLPLFEGWMHTQPDYLQRSLFPAVRSNAGDFWSDRDGLSEQLRSGMEVLHVLDQFGLGEGAGLKLLRQPTHGGQEEHVVMALLTHRGQRFPRQTSAICRALAQPLQDAVVRLRLPFTTGQSIHAQMMEEDAVGFVCFGANNSIVELNQRAYELASKYRNSAQVCSGRLFMEEFVTQARTRTEGGRVWQLVHPSRTAMLQVRMYVMPGVKFELATDLPMLKMEEIDLPPMPDVDESPVPQVLSKLTPKQLEITMMLVRTGLSPQEIATQLNRSEATIRKHVENIHRALKVRSLGELVALVLKSRN